MTSNDLLAYSIMHKGSSISSSHSRLMSIPLPFKSPSLKQLPFVEHYGNGGHISLPSISSIEQENRPSYLLTEGNLNVFNNTYPPSLTSSSATSSQMLSPNLANTNLAGLMSSPAPKLTHYSSKKESNTDISLIPPRKRRQRLGPSCDSCRSRKVKCNADITVLLKKFTEEDCTKFVTSHLLPALIKNQNVDIGNNTSIIISNDKLIRFQQCNSCTIKNIKCCFSNGFTKEDISINSKKKLSTTSSTIQSSASSLNRAKITKIKTPNSSRKFSCISCRRKKIKCVFDKQLNKCESCSKKNHNCEFDSM